MGSDEIFREEALLKCVNLGESKVREHLAADWFSKLEAAVAQEYLRQFEEAGKEKNREEDVAMVKEANRNAQQANRNSRIANMIAFGALAIAVFSFIISMSK